jgi:hypothetical protein
MERRNSEPNVSDSIEEFFEPMLSEAIDDNLYDGEPVVPGKTRLAELRRRAELRLEEKRMREELNYLDMDWEDA